MVLRIHRRNVPARGFYDAQLQLEVSPMSQSQWGMPGWAQDRYAYYQHIWDTSVRDTLTQRARRQQREYYRKWDLGEQPPPITQLAIAPIAQPLAAWREPDVGNGGKADGGADDGNDSGGNVTEVAIEEDSDGVEQIQST